MSLFNGTKRSGTGRPFEKSMGAFYDRLEGYLYPTKGNIWFVDSDSGGGDGTSWDEAKATIAEAVDAASAGDTIYISGSFNEAVTCAKAGVSFIGVGTGPVMATWTAPTVAGSWCLKLTAANCLVTNLKIRPVVYTTSGIPSGIYLSGADYTRIIGNRFQGRAGSYKAIYSPVCNSDNVVISDNEFVYMNTATHGAGIFGVEAGGLSYSGWQITNNVFHSCVTAIDINGRCCTISGNTIFEYGITSAGAVDAVLAMGIDLSGTSSGANAVWGNQLGGTYSATLYVVGASGDQWAGNYNVISGGLTAANPA